MATRNLRIFALSSLGALLLGCTASTSNPLNTSATTFANGVGPSYVAPATPQPGSTATPTPNNGGNGGNSQPTAPPTVQATTINILDPIQQMWLPDSSTDSAPASAPSTYSFQAEVDVTNTDGTVATSSDVVWSSYSDETWIPPATFSIDPVTGYASTSIAPGFQGSYQVTVMASTYSTGVSTVSQSVNLTVGNAGNVSVVVE